MLKENLLTKNLISSITIFQNDVIKNDGIGNYKTPFLHESNDRLTKICQNQVFGILETNQNLKIVKEIVSE